MSDKPMTFLYYTLLARYISGLGKSDTAVLGSKSLAKISLVHAYIFLVTLVISLTGDVNVSHANLRKSSFRLSDVPLRLTRAFYCVYDNSEN